MRRILLAILWRLDSPWFRQFANPWEIQDNRSRGDRGNARQTRDACVRFKTPKRDRYMFIYIRTGCAYTLVTCVMRDANAFIFFLFVIANLLHHSCRHAATAFFFRRDSAMYRSRFPPGCKYHRHQWGGSVFCFNTLYNVYCVIIVLGNISQQERPSLFFSLISLQRTKFIKKHSKYKLFLFLWIDVIIAKPDRPGLLQRLHFPVIFNNLTTKSLLYYI